MRRLLLAVGIALAFLVVILVARTLMVGSGERMARMEDAASQAPAPGAEQAARRLAEAVRFRTVSVDRTNDNAQVEREAAFTDDFAGFRAWLEATYPALLAEFQAEQVNGSLVYTWPGRDASLDPILVMSHYDVVPVVPGTEGDWEHAPFSGDIEGGYVWGRGTLDTKGSVIASLEAAEALRASGFTPRRTIMFLFGHDEEIGGPRGASEAAKLFAARGLHFALVSDEGGVVAHDLFPGLDAPVAMIGIAEKGSVTLELTAHSPGGHSSMPPRETAIGRLSTAVAKLQANPVPGGLDGPAGEFVAALAPHVGFGQRIVFANQWLFGPLIESGLGRAPASDAQLRTTTAPTIIEGGTKENVMPSRAKAVVNFRIHPRDTAEGILAHARRVIDDDQIDVEMRSHHREASAVSNSEGPAYAAVADAVARAFPSAVVAPYLTIAGTDSRHFTPLSDNVFRFNAIEVGPKDTARIHGTNERIAVANIGRAIAFYRTLMENAQAMETE